MHKNHYFEKTGHIFFSKTNTLRLAYFLSSIFFSFLSPSLGDGPISTEILSQRAVKPKTNKQSNPVVSGIRLQSIAATMFTVSDKNACRSIDSNLTTHSTILDSISKRFVVV